MRIKKMYQGTVPENKILNTYSDSQTDVYSSDYINKNVLTPSNCADYVVEQGENYIKWASGKLEQWLGVWLEGASISSATGSVYSTTATFGNWEVPFIKAPDRFTYSMGFISVSRNVWVGGNVYGKSPSATTGGTVYIYAPASTNFWGTVNIHAIGKWK